MATLSSRLCACLVSFGLISGSASAAITIETVRVGNAGNPAEPTAGWTPWHLCGAVAYEYRIGTFEVTAGQYTQFLNSVAKTDTYGLYNTNMDTAVEAHGCNIKRSGGPGYYSYSVAPEWADRPVNYVSFWDSCRFANWMNNEQRTGAQNALTTENGSYALNGYRGDDGASIQRNPNARWVLPTEDEWYKAAYHKNDGVTGNYWDYATGSDIKPSNVVVDPDPGNNANFYDYANRTQSIAGPYYRTRVGEFENSESSYGTYDQAGNVWEWNQLVVPLQSSDSYRGIRGGAWVYETNIELTAWCGNYSSPDFEYFSTGFRLAYVPEPTALALLAFGGLIAFRRPSRRR
jgi:formylglycine-generating enzyme